VDVTIGCVCPPRADGAARHPDGDCITFRDRLDFRAGLTVRKAIALAGEDGPADAAEILAIMTEWYCLLGIEAWTLTDQLGKPVPVSRPAIRARLLDNPDAYTQAAELADAADELYMATVLLPLLAAASTSSPPTPTAPSTSAPTASSPKSPRRSKRSSTASIPTAVIVATSSSLVGVSSSSQSSESAA
jgi:hypothetical protein